MTEIWTAHLDVTGGADPADDKLITMFTTGSNDIWPEFVIGFDVVDIKAPFGYQSDWKYDTNNDWSVYLACGNSGDEGESGLTLNTLMVAE